MSRFWDERRDCTTTLAARDWARRGVKRGTVTGPRFERASHGYHRRTSATLTAAQRIMDAVAVMPDGAWIAGWAAAYVHGVDALDGIDDHTMSPLPVPVLLPPGQRRRSTAAIEYRQSARRARGELVDDVPVTSVLRTALDLALGSPNLTEAVVALDAILATRLTDPARLTQAAARLDGRRGVRQARRAIELARPGVRSSWETRLRMFAVVELGWTDLQPNRAVFDRDGRLLGVPDLLDIAAGLAIEYDGASWRSKRSAGHRDRAQHREDNEREERLERAGLVVVRVEKADLTRFRDRLGERLRSAHEDGSRRDRTRDRWTVEEPAGWFGLPA